MTLVQRAFRQARIVRAKARKGREDYDGDPFLPVSGQQEVAILKKIACYDRRWRHSAVRRHASYW